MQNQRRGLLHIDQASKRRPFFLSHSPAKVDYLPGAPPYLKNIKLVFRGKTCHYRFKYPHTSQARLKFPTTGHGRWSMSVGCQGDVEASN